MHVPLFLWLKAFHIICIITWFAGLFYLPRLFVYHAEMGPITLSDPHQKTNHDRFCTMEYRLFWFIMTPSALLTFLFGMSLILSAPPGVYARARWLHVKLVLVGLLFFYHYLCLHYVKRFKKNQNIKSGVFFRYFNEVPSLILVLVVLLAVTKAF